MKKIFFAVSVLLVVSAGQIFSGPVDTVFVNSDSLKNNAINLTGLWRYHKGDDSTWASADYDDSDWDTIQTDFRIDTYPEDKWVGIGWFRKTVVIDSTLRNGIIAFRIEHMGASQIFWNGKFVHEFGKVGTNAEDEEIYNPMMIPIFLNLDTTLVNKLAIRYSHRGILKDRDWYNRWFPQVGFSLEIADADTKAKDLILEARISYGINFLLSGLFFSLAILYFFLFLFYQRKKENLYYSLFTFFVALLLSFGISRNFLQSDMDLIIIFRSVNFLSVFFAFVSYLGFLYSIFYNKRPRLFWILLAFAFIFSGLYFTKISTGVLNAALPVFIIVTALESLRIIIVAIRKGKYGAWVIGTGVIVFASFIFIIIIVSVLGASINNLTGFIIFLMGLFSLPVSMSTYLARQIAFTNKELEQQLETVRELSAKELEHQKRTAELELEAEKERAENERKSLELEEARKLQLSMLPKELPQLPNLDIAVYMQTATEVGGDYYDFHVDADGTLTTVIGDATGHGLNAGTIVTATKSLFNTYADNKNILHTFSAISHAIKNMNFHLLSMCLSIIKITGNKVTLSSAGMPPALIYRESAGAIEEFLIRGMPLGVRDDFPYEIRTTNIEPGDTILLMSDGFPELFNARKEMLGYDTAKTFFEQVSKKDPDEIINQLKNKAAAWSDGKPPDDDVTFVVIKMK